MQRAVLANLACCVGELNMVRLPTPHVALSDSAFQEPFSDVFRSVQKQQKERKLPGLLSFCEIAHRQFRTEQLADRMDSNKSL